MTKNFVIIPVIGIMIELRTGRKMESFITVEASKEIMTL